MFAAFLSSEKILGRYWAANLLSMLNVLGLLILTMASSIYWKDNIYIVFVRWAGKVGFFLVYVSSSGVILTNLSLIKYERGKEEHIVRSFIAVYVKYIGILYLF